MVSFNCDACNDVVKKPKLDSHHYQRCGSSFTCLDCSQTFWDPTQWKGHTTCITEAQKYEGSKALLNQAAPAQGKQTKQSEQQQGQGKRKREEAAVPAQEQGVTVKGQGVTDSDSDKKKKSKKDKKDKSAKKGKSESASPAPATTLNGRIAAAMSGSTQSVTLAEVIDALVKSADAGADKDKRKKLEKDVRKEVLAGIVWSSADGGKLEWKA